MLSLKNIVAHPLSSICGLLVGAFQAALMGAASAFAQTGNTTDWKPYAAAAASAAIPVVIGGLYAPTPAQPAAPEVQSAPPDDPKAALMAQVDAALAAAAQKAMTDEAAKIIGAAQPQA